ncbi:hypothetical protein QBC40DRAFT_196222, partial [Triangularia verruculosa]
MASTNPGDQQPPAGGRELDVDLLNYLAAYAEDPTCPPRFRTWCNDYILSSWPNFEELSAGASLEEQQAWQDQYEAKWRMYLDWCEGLLKNAELEKFGLPQEVLDTVGQYVVLDEGTGTSSTAPATKTPTQAPRFGPTPPTGNTASKPGTRVHFVDSTKTGAEGTTRPASVHLPPTPDTSGKTQDKPPEESGVGTAEADIPIDTDGPDFIKPSYSQFDVVLKPLAIHLGIIISFLDNASSQDTSFSQQLSDVVDYLQWLASGNDRRNQLNKASAYAKLLYAIAVDKVNKHVKQEQHRAVVTPVVFTDMPVRFDATRSSRLNYATNFHDFPLPSKRGVPDKSHLLPYSITPSPEKKPIQGKLLENPEHYKELLADERKIWTPYSNDLSKLDGLEIPTGLSKEELENNLAAIESDAYVQYMRTQGPSTVWATGDPIGWTIQKKDESGEYQTYISTGKDPVTGEEQLQPVNLKDPKDWASARGVRRAGLQLMLRNYRSNENDFVYFDSDSNGQRFRRLVLPVSVATLRQVMEKADGRQWLPPSLFDNRTLVWNHYEPFAYTDRFRVYTETVRSLKKQAYRTAEDRHLLEKTWIKLPKNIVHGGPFIWRGLSAAEQEEEDLLKQCLAVRDYLAVCWNKAPRPLLAKMVQLLTYTVPPGTEEFPGPETFGHVGQIIFDDSEYIHTTDREGKRQQSGYRYINDEDIRWLKFLGSGSVNKKSWTGKIFPNTPKTTYRLFHIFAKRVLRLLDDPNPDGILYSSASVVTVEDLLKVINVGANGKAAVNKYEFSVYEACQHLDRLDQTGHIDFQLDQACYGRVRRPIHDFYPEHRITFDSGGDKRASLRSFEKNIFPKSVRRWVDICLNPHTGQTNAAPAVTNAVDNFYRALAYRLGFTIFHLGNSALARRKEDLQSKRNAIPYAYLQDSIKKFNAIYESALSSLLRTRPNLPAPYGDTWKDIRSLVQDVELLDGGHADHSTDPLISRRAHLADNDSALVHLRSKIITEVGANHALLAPARAKKVVDPAIGGVKTILTRGVSWKFGSLAVRQEGWRRQYFSVNRWPLTYQSEEAANKIKADKYFIDGVDPKQTFDYQAADPIHAFFQREKLRPYVTETIKFRDGPAIFPVGDTKHQRRAVQNHMTALVYEAIGLDGANLEGTFKSKLKNFFTLGGLLAGKGKVTDLELEDKYGKLPNITPERVPRSWDSYVLVEKQLTKRKRKVDEILAERTQEEEEQAMARFKRRKVDDDIVGTRM